MVKDRKSGEGLELISVRAEKNQIVIDNSNWKDDIVILIKGSATEAPFYDLENLPNGVDEKYKDNDHIVLGVVDYDELCSCEKKDCKITVKKQKRLVGSYKYQKSLKIVVNLTPQECTPQECTPATPCKKSDCKTCNPTKSIKKPGAPVSFKATPGDSKVELAWNAPLNDGGAAITGYQVSMDCQTWVSSSLQTHTFPDLTNGTPYTFYARAVNSVGEGPAVQSESVKPSGSPVNPKPIKSEQEKPEQINRRKEGGDEGREDKAARKARTELLNDWFNEYAKVNDWILNTNPNTRKPGVANIYITFSTENIEKEFGFDEELIGVHGFMNEAVYVVCLKDDVAIKISTYATKNTKDTVRDLRRKKLNEALARIGDEKNGGFNLYFGKVIVYATDSRNKRYTRADVPKKAFFNMLDELKGLDEKMFTR